MLAVKDLVNPNITNKKTDLKINQNMNLKDIDLGIFGSSIYEYTNVVDDEDHIVGAVKTERLVYMITKNKENSFVQILDTMDAGIVVIDMDSRIFYVNPAYGKILNISISKILGRYMSIIEPEAALLDVIRTRKGKKVRNQHIKSINTYVDISTHPLVNDGIMTGAYSIFTDVTTENKLHQEVKKMSAVTEEYNQQTQAKEFLRENQIIGESKVYLECVNRALRVATTDTMVLVRGENGTGKEVIVNLIKSHCARKNRPFITVNCSAIPDTLIESELFGYEEGSFTGASKGGKMGKFQLADGGTLFLDEIGDMPYQMQAKLLRVLQEGEIEKVGRQKNIPIDVRVIAATNRNLEEMVKEGAFREDLYYRLNVVSIHIPPLRERGNDVLLLTDYFLQKYCKQYGRELRADRSIYQLFVAYGWPGNVRELKNAIESAVVLCETDTITAADLPENIRGCELSAELSAVPGTDGYIMGGGRPLKEEVENFEKYVIFRTMERCGGDKNKAMEMLGMSKRTFYRKIANYGTKPK